LAKQRCQLREVIVPSPVVECIKIFRVVPQSLAFKNVTKGSKNYVGVREEDIIAHFNLGVMAGKVLQLLPK
jgi:hypothetical protein